MKAVVLAGGHATRLWPITKERAKPLLPLGERPIIDYILDDIDQEVEETIISTNEKFAQDFEEYVKEFGRDARVIVENQDSEEEKPGTIGAILKLIDRENLQDDLLIVGGDNYFGFNFKKLLEFCREKQSPVNVVYDINDFEHAKQFGIVDTEGDRIVGFEEKPEEPPSTLASTACYFFTEDKIELFKKYEEHFKETEIPAEQYLDEPGRLIEWAYEKEDMFAFTFTGEWHDVGTPKGYLEATSAVTDGQLIEGETNNCSIGENVVVMEGAELANVVVENTIVFKNSMIVDSEVRNSIIDSNTEIEDANLNDAIIGSHSSL